MADAITGAGASSATTTSGASDRTTIAANFDSFLLLLTTQLKNQSPLDPLNTNEFTQQLVQFASVEQQLKSNQTLNALLTGVKASTAANAAGLVGAKITADGATTRLSGGVATWTLTPARAATQATITIRNGKGELVATQTKALASGTQKLTWDGRASTGQIAPEGDYTIGVTARDASGQGVTVKTEIVGTVTSVDLSGDQPALLVGGARVAITAVKSIGE